MAGALFYFTGKAYCLSEGFQHPVIAVLVAASKSDQEKIDLLLPAAAE